MRHRQNVFSIYSGRAMLDGFIPALMAGDFWQSRDLPKLDYSLQPHLLSEVVIYVPSARAVQALRAALRAYFKGKGFFYPKILPLGEDILADDSEVKSAESLAVSRETISKSTRHFLLFELVEAWRQQIKGSKLIESVAQSYALSSALGSIIDEAIEEGKDLSALSRIEGTGYNAMLYDEYWEITRKFLEIIAIHWPAHLKEACSIDEATAQIEQQHQRVKQLQLEQPTHPIIILGSTGSRAATRSLMKTVASLPRGAVLLPNLDLCLDEKAWALIGSKSAEIATTHGHAQVVLKETLQAIGILRQDVKQAFPLTSEEMARSTLLAEILRPVEASQNWYAYQDKNIASYELATSGITRIEAENEAEEARAIAVLMREYLEAENGQLAVVTKNRILSERIRQELLRWDIVVEDTAGIPLRLTAPGRAALLILEVLINDQPQNWLGLFYDEHLALKQQFITDANLYKIEFLGLREHSFVGGVKGIKRAYEQSCREGSKYAPHAARKLYQQDITLDERKNIEKQKIESFLASLEQAFLPFQDVKKLTLSQWADRHQKLYLFCKNPNTVDEIEALVQPVEITTSESNGERELQQCFEYFITAQTTVCCNLREYTEIFSQHLLKTIPSQAKPHTRLHIWGTLEARLQPIDCLILPGLNEGQWPARAESEPFLNRKQREFLGFALPERAIAQNAHDFATLASTRQVYLTRALTEANAPALASRYLRRFEAVVGEQLWRDSVARGQKYLHYARALNTQLTPSNGEHTSQRPMPLAPKHRFMEKLSITEIETLYRDPYAIFAKHILKIQPLPPLEQSVGAAEQGTFLHEVFERFVKLPRHEQETLERLLQCGEESLASLNESESVKAFWRAKFQRIAPKFLSWNLERLASAEKILLEQRAFHKMRLEDGSSLTITGKADRIEHLHEGGVAIIDYKTGTPPSKKLVLNGLSPQLPITAALYSKQAFAEIKEKAGNHAARLNNVELSYIKLSSKKGEEVSPSVLHFSNTLPVSCETIAREITLARAPEVKFSKPEAHEKNAKTAAAKKPQSDQKINDVQIIEQQYQQLRKFLQRLKNGEEPFISKRRSSKTHDYDDYNHLARVAEWGEQEDDLDDEMGVSDAVSLEEPNT